MTPAARRLAVSVPAMIVTLPLVGFSLQGDERRSLYRAANELGRDPLEALRQASDHAASPVSRGSLGPLGRVLESLQHAFVFEAAEAAGVAPHVVQGVVRAAMVAIVAVVAAGVVSAVIRSAGAGAAGEPTTALYPLVLGAVIVAGGSGGPLTLSPFASVGATSLVLGLSLVVTRDSDMQARPMRWHEPAAVAVLGAAAATTHSLVCVVPVVAAGLAAVRSTAAGQPLRALLATAALRRWAALSAGILAALVLEPIATAGRCAQLVCFEGSGLSMSSGAIGSVAGRTLTGAPAAGWAHNAAIADRTGLGFGVRDLAANSLLAVGLVAIVALTLKHALPVARHAAASENSGHPLRAAACLGALGAAVAVPAALLAGLASRLQLERPAVGEATSDTLLVQVGWSFILAGAVTAAVVALRSEPARRAAVAAVAVLVGLAVASTLLANERLAHVDRRQPLAAVVSEISEFTVIADPGDAANVLRCRLIDEYARTGPDPNHWAGAPKLRVELDRLMLERRGWPFCDPTRLEEPAPQ